MPFKYELRQRVCLPGSPGVQALVHGRGEAVDQLPIYRLRWIDGDGAHETAHPEHAIVLANTNPHDDDSADGPTVTVARPGESLVKTRRDRPARKKR